MTCKKCRKAKAIEPKRNTGNCLALCAPCKIRRRRAKVAAAVARYRASAKGKRKEKARRAARRKGEASK